MQPAAKVPFPSGKFQRHTMWLQALGLGMYRTTCKDAPCTNHWRENIFPAVIVHDVHQHLDLACGHTLHTTWLFRYIILHTYFLHVHRLVDLLRY